MPHAIVIQPPLRLSKNFIDYPYFDGLGALQAAGILRDHDWSVEWLDGLSGPGAGLRLTDSEEGAWIGQARSRFLGRLDGLEADLILVHASPFSTAYPGRGWLREVTARLGREATGLVVIAEMVMGGMHYLEYDPDLLMADLPGADILLRYEGERLLGQLADDLAQGRRPTKNILENRQAFPLDDLPAPAFDLIDPDSFFRFLSDVLAGPERPGPFPAKPPRTLPLITSRGCPYSCIFCSHSPGLQGNRRTIRTIPWEHIQEWVGRWKREMGLQRLIILDELANLNKGRFDALLDLLELHGLRVEFPNGLRADRLDEDQLIRLRRLTSQLKVSLESSSVRVQTDVLGKNLDPDRVESLAALCASHGLPLEIHYLIGIPGEKRTEMLATLDFAAGLQERFGATPRVQIATPLPGTKMERICQEEGWLGERPDDLASLFQTRSILSTDDFDPPFVQQSMRAFQRRSRQRRGRKVIVNLTYRCNNHCQFCAVGDREAEDADLDRIITALTEHRRAGFDLLDIDGGEPSLHPQLFEVIGAGRALGFERITLVTNGRLASYRSWAERLAKSGLDEVLISLHAGEAQTHDALTSAPGSFAQTVAGLRNLIEAMPGGDEAVAVNTTIVKANLSSLPLLGELLHEMGIRRWTLQVVTPFGRAHAGLVPESAGLRSMLTTILDRAPEGMRIQIINLPPCELPDHHDIAAADFGKAERNMVFVGARGENLQGFLAQRRRITDRCRPCPWSLLCPGEYIFED